MPSFDIRSEPVRGGFPDLPFLGLPGSVRARAGVERMMPPPPIHHLLGLMPVGDAEFAMPSSPWLRTSAGVFLAGTAALVADAPFGSAIIRALPPGVFGTTSELNMSFLRPADVTSGTLTSSGELIDLGRSLALSQAVVYDEYGTLLAHGSSRYVLMHLDPPPAPEPLEPYVIPDYGSPDPYLRPSDGAILPSEVWHQRSGREILRGCMVGEYPQPPFAHLFGMNIVEVEEGSFGIQLPSTEWFYSPARTIYGGILAYIADNVMTGAIWTTVGVGSSLATLDLKVNFLRPGIADGREMTARARVIHRGRRIAVAQGEVLNADGKPLVVAIGSARIMEGRAWDPERPVVVADESDNAGD